jgi:hypothetical protein
MVDVAGHAPAVPGPAEEAPLEAFGVGQRHHHVAARCQQLPRAAQRAEGIIEMLQHMHEEHEIEVAGSGVIRQGSRVGLEAATTRRCSGAGIPLDPHRRPVPGRLQRQRDLARGTVHLEYPARMLRWQIAEPGEPVERHVRHKDP